MAMEAAVSREGPCLNSEPVLSFLFLQPLFCLPS